MTFIKIDTLKSGKKRENFPIGNVLIFCAWTTVSPEMRQRRSFFLCCYPIGIYDHKTAQHNDKRKMERDIITAVKPANNMFGIKTENFLSGLGVFFSSLFRLESKMMLRCPL